MSKTGDRTLRVMASGDLDRVLRWRNHPDVRNYMFNRHEITMDEHCRWFAKTSQDRSRHLLIYEENAIPLGFTQLHQIGSGGVTEWGFYLSPEAPKGTGKHLGQTVLRFAFNELALHKICGKAIGHNNHSIHFHLSLGFAHEGTLSEQYFDGERYHDVWCFGLLASNWRLINQVDDSL